MEDSKKWYTSKTVIGIVVTAVSILLKATGVTIGDADITMLITSLFQVVGLALALYGRIVAEKKLKA
jgi:hypothetical protein